MLNQHLVFTDASVSPGARKGIGGFLVLEFQDLDELKGLDISHLMELLTERVQFCEFNTNKCTFVEIKTAVVVLQTLVEKKNQNIVLYTDCQNLCDLLGGRLKKLAQVSYKTKSGKVLEHAKLYDELSSLDSLVSISAIKIKGHSKSRSLTEEKIFAALDRLVREKLRSILSSDYEPKNTVLGWSESSPQQVD